MIPILQDYPAHLYELVFKEDATVYELLQIVVAFAFFWHTFFFFTARPLLWLTYDSPWLRASTEREYDRNADIKKIFVDQMGYTREEAICEMMRGWSFTQVVMFQHVVGSLLCVPSLMGVGDTSWASSLAALGLMSEMGYEVGDLLFNMIIYRIFFEDERKRAPPIFLIFGLIHHSLATCLGLPMVLSYRQLKPLHWITFDLQMAGATAPLTEFTKTRDLSKPNELLQFKSDRDSR